MKRFVIFGDIEFFNGDSPLIHRVHTAEHIADGDIEARAIELGNCDWVAPHYSDYSDYSIKFMQYHEEDFEKDEESYVFDASQEHMGFVAPRSLEIANAMNKIILEKKVKGESK